jgi:hypothetical protein
LNKAQLSGELIECRTLDQLVQHLVEPARFDEHRLGHFGLVLPSLIIGAVHPIAQLADTDFGVADRCDIRAADAARAHIPGHVHQRKANADQDDKGEREEFADGGPEQAANGGDHRKQTFGQGAASTVARCFRRAAKRHQGGKGPFHGPASPGLPIGPGR